MGQRPIGSGDVRAAGDGCRRTEGRGMQIPARAGTDAGAGRRAERGNTALSKYRGMRDVGY